MGFIALASLNSCDDPNYPDSNVNGEGKLSTKSLKVDVLNSETIIESRSSIDVSTFIVNVIDKSTGTVKNSWKYGEMPEIIALPVGDYKVEILNEVVKDAAWDSPYYYASKDFSIAKNEVTEIGNVTCKLANIKVSIKYSDELKALIGSGTDVKVNVLVGATESLDFAYGETRSGYFKYIPESTTLAASFSGTIDGCFINNYQIVTDVAPGQHRIITFGVKEAPNPPDEYGSIGTSGFALNAQVTRVDLTVDVPVVEDPIEPDDLLQTSVSSISLNANAGSSNITVKSTANWAVTSNQSWCTTSIGSGAKGDTSVTVNVTENSSDQARNAKLTFVMGNISKEVSVTQAAKASSNSPTITSTSLDLNNVNPIVDGMTARVDINAPIGIAHLKVEIVSPSLTPSDLADVGLSDKFDLAEPGSLEEPLKGLGFPVKDEVVGKTYLLFDITNFMSLLNMFSGEHHFVITVIDANGQSTTATLKFLAQ